MSRFERWAVWATSAATGATGLVYWWMKTWLEPADEFAVINHPLEPWFLKAHVLVAPLMVFAIGMVAAEHIWRQYTLRVRAGRRSGLLSMWTIAPLVVTGYAIQVTTHPGVLEALAWAHVAVGVAYLVGLILHHPVPRRFVHPLLQGRLRRAAKPLEAVESDGGEPG